MGLAGADGEFPVTRAATELMHDLRRKNPLRFPLLCGFFHFFVNPSGPRLAAPRWVKASYRWSGYDFGLGGEEFGSGWGENPPPNSDTCESEPEHNRIFVRPR